MGRIVGKVFKEEITKNPEVEDVLTDESLEVLSKDRLKEIAKDLDIEFNSKITKDELIALIVEKEKGE